jgi:acyl-coenzyme A thioesterase PaaI-like protein
MRKHASKAAARVQRIRGRMLRGIALNRRPGLHFPGNFLDVSFDRVARDVSRLSVAPGVWCADADGQTDFGVLAILADLALAACIRANLGRETRLGTVSMHLQFTGVPRIGRLSATGRFQGFFRRGAGKLGMSRVTVKGDAGQVCFGSGTFMALEPPRGMKLHPVPLRTRRSPEPRPLKEEELTLTEAEILRHADEALASPGSFISNFWGIHTRRTASGAECTLKNGLQVGNRVGHAQGGILVGMAAANAAAALPAGWHLSGISALYISPGEGAMLRARSKVVHHGRLTAVVRTQVTGRNGIRRRRVLEVVTTHCASA